MLLSNTKEGAINSDRGGQGGQDDIKARLENKDFTRQKREQKDSRQKEQHEPRLGKVQGKQRERELAPQRPGQGREWIRGDLPTARGTPSTTGLTWG